jgi:hypothetical protein
MYLVGTVYNFCTDHRSLRVAILLPGGRRHWVRRPTIEGEWQKIIGPPASWGDDVDGDVAHARRELAEVDQERAFYQRQAGRGRITEREFDAPMDETQNAQRHWQSELDRLKELRDNTDRVQSGLEYVEKLMANYQVKVRDINQTPDELEALPREKQEEILLERPMAKKPRRS